MNIKAWTCIFLVVATLGIYYKTSNHEFINYDDPSYVINNPHVNSGLSPGNIAWAFTSIHASNWHPLTWLSHMLDVQLFGLNPKWHHLTNVFFHVINTLLLYMLLIRITQSPWKSSFVAALFALHPLHVESVAWVSERKDVLSALFLFITLLSYDWYARSPCFHRYILTLSAFALGLMSKPMLVTLPFVLFLMDYWPLRRMSFLQGVPDPHRDTERGINPQIFFQLALEKLPFIALSIASCVITIYAQWKGGAVAKITGVPLSFRLINALVAYVHYMFKVIWPYSLSVIYPLPKTLPILNGIGAGVFLSVISTISVRMARRHPYLIVGWLWYIVMLIPVIGLVQVGSQSMADRYTYIPLIGIFIIAAWGVPAIAGEGRHRSTLVAFFASIFLVTYSLFAWRQLSYWKNSITLFRHAAQTVPGNYLAYSLLGNTFTHSGMFDEAISNYSEALRVDPNCEEAITGIGVALMKTGNTEGAVQYFRKALYLKHYSAECHSNLGFALTQQGKDAEGIRHLSEALRLQPGSPKNAEIHFHIGTSFASIGKMDECIFHFTKAIQINPDYAEAHYNLGVALAKQGKLDPAIKSFSEALRLKPNFQEAAISLEKAIRMNEQRI